MAVKLTLQQVWAAGGFCATVQQQPGWTDELGAGSVCMQCDCIEHSQTPEERGGQPPADRLASGARQRGGAGAKSRAATTPPPLPEFDSSALCRNRGLTAPCTPEAPGQPMSAHSSKSLELTAAVAEAFLGAFTNVELRDAARKFGAPSLPPACTCRHHSALRHAFTSSSTLPSQSS